MKNKDKQQRSTNIQNKHESDFKNISQVYQVSLKGYFGCMRFYKLIMTIWAILSLIVRSDCSNISIISGSSQIGRSTNYTITITNHNKPNTIIMQFQPWTSWQTAPYSSAYQVFLTSGPVSSNLLTCSPIINDLNLRCTIASSITSQLGSTIQLIFTNINNPSSSKPYPISFVLRVTGLADENITASVQATTMKNSQMIVSGWNSTAANTGTSRWLMLVQFYFDYNTVLQITYNSALVNISFTGLSGLMVTNTANVNGTITTLLSKWSDTSNGLKTINPVTVTNPAASMTVPITFLLYWQQSSTIYNIQSYTLSLVVTPASYSSIVGTSSLLKGVTAQTISISTLTCSLIPADKSVNDTSYTQFTYLLSDLGSSTCGSASSNSTHKVCRYNTSVSPKSITSVTQSVKPENSTSITFITYTYFTPSAAYLPLCRQVYTMTVSSQQISSSNVGFNTALCGTGKAGDANANTVLTIKMESMAVGDIVTIQGILGTINNSTGWTQVPNTTSYRYQLTSSSINSTHITIPLSYSNPSFITANSMTNITISRPSPTEYIYAILSGLPISLCPVTQPASLESFTLQLSNYTTYQPNINAILRFRNKFKDYTSNDYLNIFFKSYNGLLFLTNINIASSIKSNMTISSTTNTTYNNTVNITNDTTLVINNIASINNSTFFVEFRIAGLVNPATIYPINGANGLYQIVFTLMDGTRLVPKQESSAKFTSTLTTTQYTYVPNILPLSQAPQIPILTNLSSLALTFTNLNKPKYFPSLSTSNVKITLPFNCSQAPAKTITVPWVAFNGSLVVNLTQCSVGYLNTSTALISVTQDILNSTISSRSSSLTSSLMLQCPNNCQQCTSVKYCTKCVTSQYSTSILLYKGSCYSTCPARTYLPPQSSSCQDCHPSCLTCVNASMLGCTSCPQFYNSKQINITTTNSTTQSVVTANICISVCGENMYINPTTGKCQSCQIDCQYCVNIEYCYICRDGATLVANGVCDFTVCNQPCKSCQGNKDNCTSCITNQYLYQHQCYTECPTKTYPSTDPQTSIPICLSVSTPTLYFPATICSLLLLSLVCVCNSCIDRKMTSDPNRRNINMLTYSSSILAYMELFALFVLLAFTYTSATKGVAGFGLALWILANIGFAIYYCKFMRHDSQVMNVVQRMSNSSQCIYRTVVIFSIAVTLRTYRVLYCGLFQGVSPYPVKKSITSEIVKKRKGSQGRIANQDITINVQEPKVEKLQKKSVIPNKPQVQSPQVQALTGKNTSLSVKTIPNTVPANTNVKNVENIMSPELQPTPQQSAPSQSQQQHSKFQLKRPYLIYLTIGSMVASIFFLAAGINEIVKNLHPGLLFAGLDLMIVVIASIVITGFDMWVGVKKSYLMALQKGDTNQTMENLRLQQQQVTQQKIMIAKATQKLSKQGSPNKKTAQQVKKQLMKKYSPPARKNSKSPPRQKVLSPQQKQQLQKRKQLKKIKSRYSDLYKRKKNEQQSQSGQQDFQNEQLPDIKIFEDIEMYTNEDIGLDKKIKRVKNSNNDKRMNSVTTMRKQDRLGVVNSNNNLKGAKHNWKLDDIFIGFKQDEEDVPNSDKKTLKLLNTKQGKQIYKIANKKQQKNEQNQQQDIRATNPNTKNRNANNKQSTKQKRSLKQGQKIQLISDNEQRIQKAALEDEQNKKETESLAQQKQQKQQNKQIDGRDNKSKSQQKEQN